MNITVVRESLVNTLQKAGLFISTKLSDLRAFKGVYIQANQNGIVLQTTNLNEVFFGEIGGKVSKTGEVLVDFKTFFEIVKNLPDVKLELTKEGSQLLINSHTGKVKLATLDPQGFPTRPVVEEVNELPKELFSLNLLEPVLLSCATDEARPILTGVCYDFREDGIRIVGTDGFRMTVQKTNLTTSVLNGQRLVVSSRSLNSLLRVFKQSPQKISYLEAERRLIFQGEGMLVSTRLLEGEFPPYTKVIPQTRETLVSIKRNELLEVVKSSALFAREGSNMLTVEVGKENLILTSVGAGVGEAVFKITPTLFEGKENKIVFNYRYLLEFVSLGGEDEIILEMVNAFAPGVFRFKDNENLLHIIMPIRSEN